MRLVLGAVRAHRAQAAALFLLAVLAVAGASAAVGFGDAAVADARAAEVAAYGPARIVVRGSPADPAALRDRLVASGLAVATTADGFELRSTERDPERLRAQVAAAIVEVPSGFTVDDGLSGLADRLAATGWNVRAAVGVGTAPVAVVAGLAVLLVVVHAGRERRSETALAAVRGAPWPSRVALAAGPALVVLLAAAPVGYLLASAAARAVGQPASLTAAALATVFLLAVAVAALWQHAARPR
jgi:hypothetical protein